MLKKELFQAIDLDSIFCEKNTHTHTNSCKKLQYQILVKKGLLHSQEYRNYKWVVNIDTILKIYIVMAVTTPTIKKGD